MKSTVLELICGLAYAELLLFSNEQRDISNFPDLQRYLVDVDAVKYDQKKQSMLLEKGLKGTRYEKLLHRLGAGDAFRMAKKTLELCVLEHCEPPIERLLAPIQNTPDCAGVSVELGFEMQFGEDAIMTNSYSLCRDALSGWSGFSAHLKIRRYVIENGFVRTNASLVF